MTERDYAQFREELEELTELLTPLLIRAIVRLWGTSFHSVVVPMREEGPYQIYMEPWIMAIFYPEGHPQHGWDLLGLAFDRIAKHLGLPLKLVLRKVRKEADRIDEQKWLEVDAGIIEECS